jgi:hypothetical protein
MTLIDICVLLYIGQVEAGNITFWQPDDDVLIKTWNVEGVPQPTEQSIWDQQSTFQRQFDINLSSALFNVVINDTLKSTAEQKQYSGTLSILSYLHSTNTTWASEASAFYQYRDAVYSYFIALMANLNSDPNSTIPDVPTFTQGLPTITWPD